MAYVNGIRRRQLSPARVCPQCGIDFWRAPSRKSTYCSFACVVAAGAHIHATPPAERFWPKVDKSGDCWIWTAGVDGKGHGAFAIKPGKQIGAHVFAYQQAAGPIPPGLNVLHTCDVRRCARNEPEGAYIVNGIARPCFGHLFLGTKGENATDRDAKGRTRGRLSAAEVRVIRARWNAGESGDTLAAAFSLSPVSITRIVRRITWQDVE